LQAAQHSIMRNLEYHVAQVAEMRSTVEIRELSQEILGHGLAEEEQKAEGWVKNTTPP
jgi:hypothetical protein